MRLLEFVTRDPMLKLTALILAFLLWALVETGSRTDSGTVLPVVPATEDSTQAKLGPVSNTRAVPVAMEIVPTQFRVTIPIRQIQSEASGGGVAERPDPALAPTGAQP